MKSYLDCENRRLSVKRSLLAPTFFSLFSSDGSSLTLYTALGSKVGPRKTLHFATSPMTELVLSSKSNKVLGVGVIVRVSRLPHSVESGLFCERIASILEKGSLKKQP